MNEKEFQERFSAFLKSRAWSRYRLWKESGIPQATSEQWMSGKKLPRGEYARQAIIFWLEENF